DATPGAGVRAGDRRDLDVDAVFPGEPDHRVADVRGIDRLRGDLHRLPETRDAAEHRDRRARRRGTAAAGLGRGHRHARRDGLGLRPVAGADHLRVDATALLVAGDFPARGLPARVHPDASRRLRRAVHALARAVLHGVAGTGERVAVPRGHERAVLPRRRAGAGIRLSRIRAAPAAAAGRTVRDARVRLFAGLPDGAVCVPADRPLVGRDVHTAGHLRVATRRLNPRAHKALAGRT